MKENVQHLFDLSRGNGNDLDTLMDYLRADSDFQTLKTVDFALGKVNTPQGRKRLEHYLHRGTRIQRNYCVNYFRRKEMRDVILRAWEEGRIDHIQAFAR